MSGLWVSAVCIQTLTYKGLQTKVKTNQPPDGHADMGILRLPYTFRFKVVKVMMEEQSLRCNSRKNSYPSQGRLMEIPRGGSFKSTTSKYDAKLKFPEGVEGSN